MKRRKIKIRGGWSAGHATVAYRQVNNRSERGQWQDEYELVVSFRYGLDEVIIAKIAGLRNYDTGILIATGERDMMFPCGRSLDLAQLAGRRLRGADHFGALRLRISYPVRKLKRDSFTDWHDIDGRLIESVKHRRLHRTESVRRAATPVRRKKQPR